MFKGDTRSTRLVTFPWWIAGLDHGDTLRPPEDRRQALPWTLLSCLASSADLAGSGRKAPRCFCSISRKCQQIGLCRAGPSPGLPERCTIFPRLRAAELARLLASVLFSRRTWEIEKSSDRANFGQIPGPDPPRPRSGKKKAAEACADLRQSPQGHIVVLHNNPSPHPHLPWPGHEL